MGRQLLRGVSLEVDYDRIIRGKKTMHFVYFSLKDKEKTSRRYQSLKLVLVASTCTCTTIIGTNTCFASKLIYKLSSLKMVFQQTQAD